MSRKAIIPVGKTFGRLTVIERVIPSPRHPIVRCQCSCGKTHDVLLESLKSGNTSSCGCLHREATKARSFRHGFSPRNEDRAPEYITWSNMIQRCHNPKSSRFSDYGGRGIEVCERWRKSFISFLEDMGQSHGKEIGRIDNNGNYEPSNCQWETMLQQANNKRNSRFIKFLGEHLTVAEWERKTGLPYKTIWKRIRLGWPAERALTEPSRRAV